MLHQGAPLALAVVVGTSLSLIVLGGGALVRPETAQRFLGGFANTRRTHFLALAMRMVAGAALVRGAPGMAVMAGIASFGWTLTVTSLVLVAAPLLPHAAG